MKNPRRHAKLASFRKEFDDQVAVFEKHLPKLLKHHRGEFVAVCDGKLVGFGADENKLFERANKRCKGKGKVILLQKVEPRKVHELT